MSVNSKVMLVLNSLICEMSQPLTPIMAGEICLAWLLKCFNFTLAIENNKSTALHSLAYELTLGGAGYRQKHQHITGSITG